MENKVDYYISIEVEALNMSLIRFEDPQNQ